MLFTPAVSMEKLVRVVSTVVTADEVGFVSIQH